MCTPGGDCPDKFTCTDLSQFGMGSGAACAPAGGGGGLGSIPPMCQTAEQCATAGLPEASCAAVSDLIPVKFCVQSCTLPVEPDPQPDAGTDPDPVPVDAGP